MILRKCWPPGQGLWQGRAAWPVPDRDRISLDPLTEPTALAHAAGACGAVLCLAGVTPAGAAMGGAMADNTGLALAAVRAGAAAQVPVLLASSVAVYGDRAGPLSETTPLRPLSDYGRAKADMEAAAAALGARLGGRVTALRIGNVAGSDAALGGWRPGFALDRFADGRTPARSYIGPLTLARVLGDLAAATGLPGALNLAAPGAVEMGALLDAAGLRWTPRPAPDTAIPELRLEVCALQGFTTFDPRDSLPATMVAEWHEAKHSREK